MKSTSPRLPVEPDRRSVASGSHSYGGRPTTPRTRRERRVRIEGDQSIVAARHEGRILALRMGFTTAAATLVATAISELARNILIYAGTGEIVIESLQALDGGGGVAVLARDRGPGIGDVRRALEDGFSTSGRMGIGLPGVRRLMDEFEVVSSPQAGTLVRAVKWRHS